MGRVGGENTFILRSFYLSTQFSGAKFSTRSGVKAFCSVLIRVTAFHTVLGTLGESYCYAITLVATACAAVSGDNYVLWFEAQGSSYFLIRVL